MFTSNVVSPVRKENKEYVKIFPSPLQLFGEDLQTTRMGANFLPLQESESEVAQLCPTLCDPMDCSLPGSSVHGIFQGIVLEWTAISFSRGIFPTQGSNPGLPHCRQMLYCLSHRKGTCIKRCHSSHV